METETKLNHSPAPWINDGAEVSARVDPENSPSYIAPVCSLDPDWHPDIMAANARLISAAPELLACLLDVLDADGDLDAMDFKRYRAAIERATG